MNRYLHSKLFVVLCALWCWEKCVLFRLSYIDNVQCSAPNADIEIKRVNDWERERERERNLVWLVGDRDDWINGRENDVFALLFSCTRCYITLIFNLSIIYTIICALFSSARYSIVFDCARNSIMRAFWQLAYCALFGCSPSAYPWGWVRAVYGQWRDWTSVCWI